MNESAQNRSSWPSRLSALARQGIAGAFALTAALALRFGVGDNSILAGETPWLTGWLVYGAAYLALALSMALQADPKATRDRAQRDDPGTFVLFVVVMFAAWASLGAVVTAVNTAHDLHGLARGAHLALSLASLAIAWLLIQISFTLHYARLYYRPLPFAHEHRRGLAFPGGAEPDYLDFLYYAAIVGMTSQVSDVTITERHMRRLTLVHGIVSFAFNLVVLALAVNVFAASLG